MYKAWPVAVIGGLTTLGSLYGWALEPATAPEEPAADAVSEPEPEPDGDGEVEPEGESAPQPESETEPEPAPSA